MGRIRNSGAGQEPHRPGPLVQSNKKHKFGKHRTKGMIDHLNSGKVSSESSSNKSGSKKHKISLKRVQRRLQKAALRKQRLRESVDMKRGFGGVRGAPISVCLVPLSATTNPKLMAQHLFDMGEGNFDQVYGNAGNSTHLRLKNGKNLSISLAPATTDLWALLDLVKMSDVVVFLLPILEPLTPEALTLLRCVKDQGMTTPFLAVGQQFSKTEEKAFLKSMSKSYFPTLQRIYPISNPGQVSNLLRMISVAKIQLPKNLGLRTGMLIETFKTMPASDLNLPKNMILHMGLEETSEVLEVTGIIRRRNLDPMKLVHVPGVGNFQILRINVVGISEDEAEAESIDLPERFLLQPNINARDPDVDTEEVDDAISVSSMELDLDDVGEDFDNCSVSSSDKEDEDDNEELLDKKEKKLPKGTSDYQADWLDEDDHDDSDEDSKDEAEELESDGDKSTLGSEHSGDEAEDDEDMDWVEEQKELKLAKEARTEAEFPDWIDTPLDTPAKVRFQRYRGLQSFKTSPWDPNENLPKDYSRLVQFGNYKHTYKKVVLGAPKDGFGFIPIGQRVKMVLRPLGDGPGNSNPGFSLGVGTSKPTALVSLFPHETKTSVLNLHLNVTEVLKNKEPLIFQVGFQRFMARPILSEVCPGNKHKMLRFAQAGMSCMASVICPIHFPPAPVLVFKVSGAGAGGGIGNLTHVATGSLFSIDPARIIVKRILLSGYPHKSHGRKATVRFMFFNREDIEWFKPVELRTRYGRRGHIREPLGTHGHMKCIFDGPTKSQDTVLMPLYKRVFPKSTFDSQLPIFSVFDGYKE